MSNARVAAVTGGTGFIGRVLVQNLLQDGWKVRLLTRKSGVAATLPPGQIEIWQGDLLDSAGLAGFAKGADTVYHLAGEIRDPRRFQAVNVEGTHNLLVACQSVGVRCFLYLSSVGVMGVHDIATRVDETMPCHPRNAYEESKFSGEVAALSCHRANGMHVSAVRPSIVFGEGKKSGKDSFLALVQLIQSRRFVMLGKDYVSSYVYVGDVAAACRMVADHPQSGGNVYIVNEPVPLNEIVNAVAEILGVSPPPVFPRVIGLLSATVLRRIGRFGSLYNRTVFSMDKLVSLGFKPPFGYRQGLQRTIDWYRQVGLLPPNRSTGSGVG